MLNVLFDFIAGFVIGRTARNSALAARNSARIVEMASWTEEMKRDHQKREKYLAGQRRFVFGLFGVLIAVLWIVGALTGG